MVFFNRSNDDPASAALLGYDPRAIRHQGLYQGLTGLGMGLMQAGAPSTDPGNQARGIAAGLGGFNQGFQGAQNSAFQRMLMGGKIGEMQEQQRARANFAGNMKAGNPIFDSLNDREKSIVLMMPPEKAQEFLAQREVEQRKEGQWVLETDPNSGETFQVNKLTGKREQAPLSYDQLLRLRREGKTSVGVNVGAPSFPVPKIDPATGRFLGFEQQAQAQPAAAGKGGGQPRDPSGLGTPTINILEESSLKAGEGLARITGVLDQFKPEYQEIGTRLKNAGVAFTEKFGRAPSEEEKRQLSDFTQYRRRAIEVLNVGIKDQTGASMSVQEAERITMGLPNPGMGLVDGDSPTEFIAKARSVESDLRNAQMRANWARRNGLDPTRTGVELQDVPRIVNARGKQIEETIRKEKPGWGDDEIKQAVRRQLGAEFGMNR